MDMPQVNVVFQIRDSVVTLRPITPADSDMEADFVRRLSEESRYFRFHTPLQELTPKMLETFTRVSYPDAFALIATVSEDGRDEEVGVTRYARYAGTDAAEIAIVVADHWQGSGLGTRMLTELRDIARGAGIRHFYMNVLRDNRRMLHLARKLGFHPSAQKTGDLTSQSLGKSIQA